MPGWIIQGVRGEGKSLCAVGKIKDYLSRGRPVATNLDLYLENLVDDSNPTNCYRLPDYPRSVDFDSLPPAYDVRYKGEDRNGLLVLDESIIWLNSRNYQDKDRQHVLNWLILSRKDHWDLIFLCQDHEAIDKTARSSLCDYLVQSSRSDRKKSSIFTTIRSLLLFQSYKPTLHSYEVYYGFSFANPPEDTWEFTGTDLYDSYDTNQKFRNGKELVNGKLIDMRATYSYLPASYLSKHHYKKEHIEQLNYLETIQFQEPPEPTFIDPEQKIMASKSKQTKTEIPKFKLFLMLAIGLGFGSYRFFTSDAPDNSNTKTLSPVSAQSLQTTNNQILTSSKSNLSNTHRESFLDILLSEYKPRLSIYVHNNSYQYGVIEFYEGSNVVEQFSIKELHSLGAAVVNKPYGVDLITSSSSTVVTAWAVIREKETINPSQSVIEQIDSSF